jgi:RND family efflux transporter MFP subunit
MFATDAFPGKVFTGRVKFINPTVNQADRSVRVEAEVPNRDGVLKGGLFVRGKIIVGYRQGVLQVPRAALVSWTAGEKKGELFVTKDGIARRRIIQTGATSADHVEIIGGLAAGEEVIIRGSFTVKDGDRVKIVGNGGGA